MGARRGIAVGPFGNHLRAGKARAARVPEAGGLPIRTARAVEIDQRASRRR